VIVTTTKSKERPQWRHYCDHLTLVECTDASGRDYMGVSSSSWDNCDNPLCYLCTGSTYEEWRASSDAARYFASQEEA